ncbi:MAG: hypothetical protein CME63_07940 [Halobacteriovoraceae bacterium]|nr:hypothetical protein [Halobacteriovoraceae bacterium]MBC97664.1 hypothetical protein [Halobacteriovoraceae bacterium]|tara:strand:- start:106873 stop:107313 length:441 start_codon:yes stop_codon:yes gene_type:complete
MTGCFQRLIIFSLFLTLAGQELAWAEDKAEASPATEKADGKKNQGKHDTEGMDQIERERYEPRISNKWFRGSYLIYDCSRGNYICVNYQSFYKCTNEREEDKKESRPALRCAPFKKFATQEKCFGEQYRQIQNQKPKVFCMNPKYY